MAVVLIEQALKAHLAGAGADELSTRLGMRFYPSDAAPQNLLDANGEPLEYMTYRKSGGEAFGHQKGGGSLGQTVFVLTAFAKTAIAVAQLMELIRMKVDGFRGTIGSGANTATVRSMRLRDARADAEDPFAGRENGIFRETKELVVNHVITPPTYS